VVSQFAPRTSTTRGRFPVRNATLAGMADAVVIMLAASGSGSRHTAEAAFGCGRPVLVAPSDPADRDNAGGLGLLRTRAHAIGTPADLLETLQLTQHHRPQARLPHPPLPAELGEVLSGLDFSGQSLDELTRKLELPAAVILDRLLALELAGAVARQPGPRYVRIR
jgi:DNA processing protein